MPWFNVDDGFADHPKTIRVGNAAVGLWTRAGSWCAKQLTDGFVPQEIASLFGTTSQARRLVAARLWVEVEGGYQFHQWSGENRNPTRDQVLAKRARDAEKKARSRASQKNEERIPTGQSYYKPAKGSLTSNEQSDAISGEPQVSNGCPPGSHAGVPVGVPGGVRLSTPLHSTPKEEQKKTSSSSPRKRGTRIPDDFSVSPEMVSWARQRTPHVDGRHETEKFINYWQATSGQKAVKRDWEATWRNWMLTAAERAPTARASPRGSATDDFAAQFLAQGKPAQPPLRALPGGA